MSIGPIASNPFSYIGLSSPAAAGSGTQGDPSLAEGAQAPSYAAELATLPGGGNALAALGVPGSADSSASTLLSDFANGQLAVQMSLAQEAAGAPPAASGDPAGKARGPAASQSTEREADEPAGEDEAGGPDAKATPRVDTLA